MINRLRIIPDKIRIPEGNGDSIGFGVRQNGDTIVADFGRTKGRKYVRTTPATPVLLVTASTTLTASQVDGLTVVFDTTTSSLVTLPAAATCKGARIKAVWKQLTAASTGHGFNPVAADFIGGGVSALTVVVNKDLYSASGSDTVNDRIELTSDGVNGWLVTDFVGTFSKEA